MQTTIIQMRQRGVITLPAELRRRYELADGDTFTIVDLDGAFFLVPRVSVVPKLATEIERLRQEAGLSVEDLLEGLEEQRVRYYRERYGAGC